jgi:hypothetical protein
MNCIASRAGQSVFDAVSNAMRFFADPFWRGPKPDAMTVFTVALVGDERTWRVRGSSVWKSTIN